MSTENTESAVQDLNVNVNGVRWRYQHAGSGHPLLLVHGLLGYSFSWRYTIPALAPYASVFAIDLPGSGFSDRPLDIDCSLQANAERVLQFMDKVGIESCHLLGSSYGGGLAMFVAAIAPSRVKRLILAAPINPWSSRGTSLSIVLSNPPVSSLFSKLGPVLPALHEVYLRRLFGDPRRMRPGTLEGYSAPLRRPGAFEHSLGILRTWNEDLRELRAQLPKISKIPTLLIWGSLDGAVYPSSATLLAQEFRQCQLLMLEGIGHLPYEEVPQEFNRAVLEFLRKDFP